MNLFRRLIVGCFTLLFLNMIPASAQVPEKIIHSFHQIIQYIRLKDYEHLSNYVVYPLNRESPLPDIKNKDEFKARASVLFDQAFVKLLKQYSDHFIFEHHDDYGLVGGVFDGQLWLDGNGKIKTLNYYSDLEKAERLKLIKSIQSKMHPSVRQWDENVMVGKSGGLMIRIDRVGKQLRYAAWSKGRTIDQKPDMVILNGEEEPQGTMGGWTWTFRNNDWTYLISDNEICGDDIVCGYTLQLLQGDKLVKNIPLQLIK